MLVLTRKCGEKVVIALPDGRRIGVMPVLIGVDKVRLGIDAPDDVVVHRQEVWDEIRSLGPNAPDAQPQEARPA